MNSEEIKAKIALLRGQGNQVDLAGVLADVLEAIIDTPAPPANDPRIVGAVSAESPATIGKAVEILGTVSIGDSVSVGNNTLIGKNVRISDNAAIDKGASIDCPVLGTSDGFCVNNYRFEINTTDRRALIITTEEGHQYQCNFD